MNSRVLNRFLIGLVGLGALALLVPAFALAGVRPDDRSGPFGAVPLTAVSTATPSRPDDRAGTLGIGATGGGYSTPTLVAVRPDDRAGTLGIGASSGYSMSDDVFTRAVARHEAAVASASPLRLHRSGLLVTPQPSTNLNEAVSASATSSSSDGFQWLDAAIGGAGVLAICMLVLGAVAVQRQHRHGAIAH